MLTEDFDELAFLHAPDCPTSQARALAKAVHEKALAEERERCAKLCEANAARWNDERAKYVAHECAAALRA